MKYSITNDTITVVADGNIHTIHDDMPTFEAVRSALFRKDFSVILDLISPAKAIVNWSQGDFHVVNGCIHYKDDPLPAALDRRILQMIKDDSDPSALTNFWEKLQGNPSARSVEQVFSFLVHDGIPLTPEGDILAYKSVKSNYMDHHTGKISNLVGAINEMPRNKISDDPNHACHYGFHVGALKYAKDFHHDGNIVICKVHPSDVVCVPYDCSQQKVRVCKYEVVADFGEELPSTVFTLQEGENLRSETDSEEPSYVAYDDKGDYSDDYWDDNWDGDGDDCDDDNEQW